MDTEESSRQRSIDSLPGIAYNGGCVNSQHLGRRDRWEKRWVAAPVGHSQKTAEEEDRDER